MFSKNYIAILLLFLSSCIYAQNVLYIGDSGLNKLFETDFQGNILNTIDEDINTPRECVEDPINNLLFCINENIIVKYDLLNDYAKTEISNDSELLISIDLDKENEFIYYADFENNSIHRMDYNGNNKETLITDVESPSHIFIDTYNQKIISNDKLNSIVVFDLDGSNKTVLIEGLDNCGKLTVDPVNNTIYFVENNELSKVHKIDYKGENQETIAELAFKIRGLEIDCENNKLYFTSQFNDLGTIDLFNYEVVFNFLSQFSVIGFVNISNEVNCQLILNLKEDRFETLQVSPNPFENILEINYSEGTINDLKVYSTSGKLLSHFPNSSNTKYLDLSHILPQILVIKAVNENGEVIIKKVIKQ